MVYNAVLDAHTSVIAAMKPGVSWPVSNYAHIEPMSSMALSIGAGRLCSLGVIVRRSIQNVDALVKTGFDSTFSIHSCQQSRRAACRLQDMHMLAEQCILSGLKAAGIVTGDIQEMLEKRIGALFMPHGLCQSTKRMLVP